MPTDIVMDETAPSFGASQNASSWLWQSKVHYGNSATESTASWGNS